MNEIKLNITKYFNIKETETIIVGVSSGPDSMALLHYLINSTNFNIICAHVNHNVRKESKQEEKYLKEYCKKNNILFESTIINNYEENNFENEARNKRYTFFERLLKKYNANYLFLAHHGDDLIETIIMKIIRGSNIKGYAGFEGITKHKDYYIVRPFISYTKDELMIYCEKNKITYFIDNSNIINDYTRNRIRNNILPLLKKEDNNVHTKFLNYSNTLMEYYNYINNEVIKIIPTIMNKNIVDISKLRKLDIFLIKNILYYILLDYNINVKTNHINNIIKLINSSIPNQTINLPNKIKLTKEYDKLIFNKLTDNDSNYKILLKDVNNINGFHIKRIDYLVENGNDICRIDSNKIKLPLYIRNKQKGDYIEPMGLNGKKKLKDIFIEKKVPISKRKIYPIIVDSEDKIIWLPNLKKSKFNSKISEKYDIILKCYEEEDINE